MTTRSNSSSGITERESPQITTWSMVGASHPEAPDGWQYPVEDPSRAVADSEAERAPNGGYAPPVPLQPRPSAGSFRRDAHC